MKDLRVQSLVSLESQGDSRLQTSDFKLLGGKMNGAERIMRVDPAASIPGGEVAIECKDFDTSHLRSCSAWFDGATGHLVGASRRRVLAIVPDSAARGEVEVSVESRDERSAPANIIVC